MPSYHVFVDGPADATPAGVERLAAAIAEHYGLPVADLRARIASGRFRVKGNCDGATADMYVRDLTRLGARCSTEEASAHNRANTPLPFPAVKAGASTTLPPPQKPVAQAKSTLPPKTTAPPATKAATSSNYQSGLSAAFSPGDQEMSLGALEDGALLKLASVDGADDAAPHTPAAPAASFEPPASASIGPPPAAQKPSTAKPAAKPAPAPAAKPKDEPLDMFAPPDAESDDFKVELAADDAAELNARKRASTPPPMETAGPAVDVAPSGPGRYSRPSLQAPNAGASSGRAHPLGDPRVRVVLGVVIAIVLGFVPATLVASSREKSAYATIDTKIVTMQNQADTPDAYAALDTFRAEQLSRKYDERRSITITALLIWAAIGGAFAYVWFKRVPWQRFET